MFGIWWLGLADVRFWFVILVVRGCMIVFLVFLFGWLDFAFVWFGRFGWCLGCYCDLLFLDWIDLWFAAMI